MFFIRMAGRLSIAIGGVQDMHLTGNPTMSYFLTRFKRHTNFAFEVLESQFNGNVTYGNIITCKVPTDSGDFIKNMTFKLTREPLLPGSARWSPSFMSHLVEYAELLIGGQIIEKITGEYIYIYQQLRNNEDDTSQALYFLTGHGDLLDFRQSEYTYFLDLPFYFYRNPGLSIPTCTLYKQSIEVRLKLRNFNELVLEEGAYGGDITRTSLNVEYVHVSPDERSVLLSNEINNKITQVQLSSFKMKSDELKKSVLLNFKNPVKEMYFVSQSNVSVNNNFPNQYTPIKSLELKLNNETLFRKSGKDVSYGQTLDKYINSPIASEFGGPIEEDDRRFGPNKFGIHSFSLYPTQPNSPGHLNMSRIANKLLNIEIDPLPTFNDHELETVTNTRTSQIDYELISTEQVPFTETTTNVFTRTTTTPLTIEKQQVTKKETVVTNTTTTTTTLRKIGLSSNTIISVNTISTNSERSTNQPVVTNVISTTSGVSTVSDSTPTVVGTSRVYETPITNKVYTLQSPTILTDVSQTTITTSTSTSEPVYTSSRVLTSNTDTPSLIVVESPSESFSVPLVVPVTSVDNPSTFDNTTSTPGSTSQVNDPNNVTQDSSIISDSTLLTSITNPTQDGGQINYDVVTTTQPRTIGIGGGSTDVPVTTTLIENYIFDWECTPTVYGSICDISHDGSRVVSTAQSDASLLPYYIYRFVRSYGTTDGNTFIREFEEDYKSISDDARLLIDSANQVTTNFDGSVIATSYYKETKLQNVILDFSAFDDEGTHDGRPPVVPGGPPTLSYPLYNDYIPSGYTYTEFIKGWNWSFYVDGEPYGSWDNRKWFTTHDNTLWLISSTNGPSEIDLPGNFNNGQYNSGNSLSGSTKDDTHINVIRYTESFDDTTIGNGNWGTIHQLFQPDNTPPMNFGSSISMNKRGDRIAVSGIVVPQHQSDSGNIVVIYDYNNSTWSDTIVNLPVQSGNANYGIQVCLNDDGNVLCVTMHGSDNNTFNFDGKCFIYTFTNNTWFQTEELDLPSPLPSNPSNAMFGRSISMDSIGDKILIGAPQWNGGRAFLYYRPSGAIYEISPNTQNFQNFGYRVDISKDGTTMIIGGGSNNSGVEIWSHEDNNDVPYFQEHHGTNIQGITDVSINMDGTKYAYSSTNTNKIYLEDDRVSLDHFTDTNGTSNVSIAEADPSLTNATDGTPVKYMPKYKVPMSSTTLTKVETEETITPFDEIQGITENTELVEETIVTENDIRYGIVTTETTENGTRESVETTITQSLTTTPVDVSQEHDTRIYAVNYNILTFRDGLAGLRF
jgi:hypothetical protein